jgi:hypothetical protein
VCQIKEEDALRGSIKRENKEREELRVPKLDLPHQEQKERPLRTEQKFRKDTNDKPMAKDVTKLGMCYAFLHGKCMLGSKCKFRHESTKN